MLTYRYVQNPNVGHSHALLTAELAALKNQHARAITNYQIAIRLAGRLGYRNDQGLAHERFGDYYRSIGEDCDAKYHTMQAIELYREWKATVKVEKLEAAYSKPISFPAEIEVISEVNMGSATLDNSSWTFCIGT
jgi:tetratricopeptide (TPR) repeat protein